jgi:TldD protein
LENKVNVHPSGNARAFDFRVAPIIRMRNTYFDLGDFSWEELLEGIKFGYYLVDFRGGQASPEGTFTVGVQEAYEIVNGELGSPVRGVSISGNTLKTVHGISGAGKDGFSLNPGRCGKGQTAFTGDGGPNIRVDSITVSGEN